MGGNALGSAHPTRPARKIQMEKDLASFGALRRYYTSVLGFTYPEGELRQSWNCAPDGRVGKERNFPGIATLMSGMRSCASIPIPALVIEIPCARHYMHLSNVEQELRAIWEDSRRYTEGNVADPHIPF